jgi:two-component system CheB/CheR fusion protein
VAIVGIGASAGGLEALKGFFGAMPAGSGLAFIVVLHLDPTHDSLMPELLARHTTLTVKPAADGEPIEPDHVYIIPPNRSLTVAQERMRVEEPAERRSLRTAIDQFFRSLAADQRERAICIVLSGTGTEGTLGLRAVKAEGGMVMAQDPDTASHPGMPASAIATGLVDYVLPPDGMAVALLAYLRNGPAARPAAAVRAEQKTSEGLRAIIGLLRARTKRDFRAYKKGTLQRRVERRMGLCHVGSVAAYVQYLGAHPEEVNQLFKDLLIGVTSFFRDPPVFEELTTRVLAKLVREKDADSPLRIWVPGCSTGEEAYSIAIAIAEQAVAPSVARVQIFATDIDEAALQVARAGVYPESIALDVNPQRLQRFFTRDDHRYTVSKAIRESVMFAVQDLIGDPPFSKLDLVSCRNVLIYLDPEVQAKVLTLFHLALNRDGYLLLGNAESTGARAGLFGTVSKRARIYQRRGLAKRPAVGVGFVRGEAAPDPIPSRHAVVKAGPDEAFTRASQQLLEHLAPAAVVIRRTGQVVHFYGSIKRYLNLPTGRATLDVVTLAREPLRPTIRAVLHDAIRHGRRVSLDTVYGQPGRRRDRVTLRVTAKAVTEAGETDDLWLVIFEELPIHRDTPLRVRGTQASVARRLEAELRATKRDQQRLIDQLERSNEELKAAHEEVLSMNEELQSTNEELETSKEELQSLNEELTTLNTQLQEKVQEVTAVNDDLANLLASSDIATVFLDGDLRVRLFTTAATRLLNLMPSDIGRPLTHLAHTLVDLDLSLDAHAVLRGLEPVEREAQSTDGTHYLVRTLPYRSEDQTVPGVVVTLTDVTGLKTIERELRNSWRRQEAIARLGQHALVGGAPSDLMIECVNTVAETLGTDVVAVLEQEPNTTNLVLRGGVGWEPAAVGGPVVASGPDAIERAALRSDEAVTFGGGQGDTGIAASAIVGGRRMASGVAAAIRRGPDVWGVLAALTTATRAFSPDELHFVEAIANALGTALMRNRVEDELHRMNEILEQRVNERTKWLTLLHETARVVNDVASWDEALRLVLHHLCRAENWQVGTVYLPDKDAPEELVPAIEYVAGERFEPLRRATQRLRFPRGHTLPGRVYAEGSPIWANGRQDVLSILPLRATVAGQVGLEAATALPLIIGEETIAVLELLSDQPHEPSEGLVRLMNDVGVQIGRIVERERFMGRVAEMAWREQQDLIHTLHDSLGQELTGLGMLSASLAQRFKATDAAAAATAQQIAEGTQRTLERVRELSKGLFPVDVDAEGLMVALRQLASTTESLYKTRCRLEYDAPILIRDNHAATQLYRITQEAVTNALRHARAQTITVRVGAEAGTTTLTVADDGVGLQTGTPSREGMGLRIMRYRASSIGAVLAIGPGMNRGTVVTCMLRGARRPEV